MKKILVFLFAFVSILLVSCSKKEEIVTRRDNPHTDNASALSLSDVKSGNLVLDVDTSLNEYYLVKTASNINESLFVFETELDETFEYHLNRGERVRKVNISALSFSAEITDNELLQILTTVFAEDAINKEKLGLSNDLNVSFNGTTTADVEDNFTAYKNENVKGNKTKVIYLPTYAERIVDGEVALAVYVMIPVYYEIITNDKPASAAFDGIDTPNLVFDEETKLLASNEA